MADGLSNLSNLKIAGEARCVGGTIPHPPVADYPLLYWAPLEAPGVRENGKGVAVEDIARALPETPSYEALAAKFGTSEEHVRQAVDYAFKAGFLGPKE